MTKQEFQEALATTSAAMHGYQVRFAAFVAHLGFEAAYKGTVASRLARFQNWISERKSQYAKAYPGFMLGGVSIASQEHFTDFITRGDWIV